MKRLFLAVDLTAEALSELGMRVRELRHRVSGVKWVDPERMHVTLKFLGNTPEDQVAKVIEVAAGQACGTPVCRLSLRRLGAFPSVQRPRVLWVGLEGEVAGLVRLAAGLDAGLVGLGFAGEGRAFAPHVTVARVRAGERVERLAALVARFGDREVAGFTVSELVVYWSELLPAGPRYTALARLPFATRRAG